MYLWDAPARLSAVASVCHMACHLATNPDASCQPHWTVSGNDSLKRFCLWILAQVDCFNFCLILHARAANVSDRYTSASRSISSIGEVSPLQVHICQWVWLMAWWYWDLCVATTAGAWQLSSAKGALRVKIVNKLQRRNDLGEIHRFKFRKIYWKNSACTTKWNVWKIVVNFFLYSVGGVRGRKLQV